MKRLPLALLWLLVLSLPASALTYVGGSAPVVITQTIASVAPSTASFVQGTSAGTNITALTATMSPPSPNFLAGGGSFALSTTLGPCTSLNGANNSLVQISSSNLQVSAAGASATSGTYHFCFIAQTSAATNSPQGSAVTLTISSGTQSIASITPTSGSYTSGASSGTTVFPITVAMLPSSPSFTGTLALSGTAAADFTLSSTTLPSNLQTNGSTPTCTTVTPLNLTITATQAGASGSPFPQNVTVSCNPSSGTVVLTKSFFNSASSSTPTGVDGTFPAHTFVPLAPSSVTAGNIPVPSVGGSPVRYQLDSCARPWKDGSGNLSMAGCQATMFLPQLTAGSTEQVSWSSQSGALPAIGGQGTISGTTFTATAAPTTGFYMKGQTLSGTGITGSPTITALGTGTGGIGTYTISASETVASPETITALGSYASSSCSVSCITANSNLIVKLQGVNNTYWNSSSSPPFMLLGVNVSSGQVTGGTIRTQPGLSNTCSFFNCSAITINGCAVSPVISVTLPSTVSVVTPGSGCTVQGSGNYSASINTALNNGAWNSTNKCGIIQKYLDGPVADGWEIACQFTDDVGGAAWGFPGPFLRAWVEDVKNSDGSVYAVRAVGMASDGLYQAGGTFTSYTYDMQWMNGGACIRCASAGYTAFTRIQQDEIGGAMTVGPTAQMDWIPVASGVTNSALNAVVTTMTNGDAAYLKASHLIPPIADDITPGNLVLTATGTQGATSDIGSYSAFGLGTQDCESSFGQGGQHCWFGPIPSNAVNHYINSRLASDKGLSWLQSNRVGAASMFSCISGVLEQATLNPVNVVPAMYFTPPAAMTDPVRTSASVLQNNGDMVNGGIVCETLASTAGVPNVSPFDYSHYPNFYRYAYVEEGEQWMLRGMDANVSNLILATPSYQENPVAFSTNTYYGLITNAGQGIGHRGAAWSQDTIVPAVKFLPPTDTDAIYYTFLLFQDWQFHNRFQTYVGSFTAPNGSGPGTGSKPANWSLSSGTASGYPLTAEDMIVDGNGDVSPPHLDVGAQFINAYWSLIWVDTEMLFPNESADLDTFASEAAGADIANAAAPCTYNTYTYTEIVGDSEGNPVQTMDSNYSNPWTPAHGRPNNYERNSPIFLTFAGQAEVEMSPEMAESFDGSTATALTHASASAASGNTISVNDLSTFAVGSVIIDLGQPPVTNENAFAAPLVGTGAIPTYFYVATKSGNSGAGTITIACGKTGGCTSSGITSPGVASGDVLAVSERLDYPDLGGQQSGPNNSDPTAVGNPMPSGSWTRPTDGAYGGDGGEFSQSTYMLGTYPAPASPALSDLVTQTPYVWCPDSANANGTTGHIDTPGHTCTALPDSNAIVFSGSSAHPWGWWPNAACPTSPPLSNWENVQSSNSPQGRPNQLFGISKYYAAVFGSTANTTAAIATLSPLLPDTNYTGDPGNTFWAISKGGFAPGP